MSMYLRIRFNSLRLCNVRYFAEKNKQTVIGLSEKPEPDAVSCDYIGPPDKDSNLRPYVRCISKDETPLAQELRMKQDEVEKWNQEFWAKHNKRFYDEKQDFIKLHSKGETEDIPSDVMSVFYKSFLDKNRKMHIYYNISWYLKNFDLLVHAGQVNLQKLWRRIRS